ncbi:MAG: DNA mismatch repair endonuclease MutL [Pseudomonadota bacterium]
MTHSVIRQLSEDLINQIAAGEVVERPASVLKELIENSLDSGASQIDIVLFAGGLDEIRVLDNGSGISPLDLPLSIQRHATSKIKTAADLEAIATFGFRGEALSSICSVSNVTITSRTAHEAMAYQLTIDEGLIKGPIQMLAAPIGTQVVVSHLFKHTPARRKFLRSNHTELAHCQRVLKEIALANPKVRFALRNESRLLATWVSPTRKERFQECLKLPWAPLEIRGIRDEITLEAYLSPPEHSVSRSELFLFINGRPVRHRAFLSAIRTAFQEMFGVGKEPIGTCYLDLRKDWVDVNVHPQKWEVRCFNQESIFSWLLTTFRKQLNQEVSSFSTPPNYLPSHFKHPSPTFSDVPLPSSQSYPFHFLFKNDKFLICEDTEGLIVSEIGPLAIQFEASRLLDLWKKNKWPVETLLIPKICRLPEKLRPILDKSQPFLTAWGFQNDLFGDGDFSLRTRPSFVPEEQLISLFLSLLSHLSDPRVFQESFSHPEQIISWLLSQTNPSSASYLSHSLGALMEELVNQMNLSRNGFSSFIHRIPVQSSLHSKDSL